MNEIFGSKTPRSEKERMEMIRSKEEEENWSTKNDDEDDDYDDKIKIKQTKLNFYQKELQIYGPPRIVIMCNGLVQTSSVFFTTFSSFFSFSSILGLGKCSYSLLSFSNFSFFS